MDSKEFGLVAAQQLFQIEDLHYGYWDNPETANLSNWKEAQARHTNYLFDYIKNHIEDKNNHKILDIGCGVGLTTKKLLENNFRVDGLVPYNWMAKYAEELVSKYKTNNNAQIYECKFEDFPIDDNMEKYHLAFFSESYQYVKMEQSFKVLDTILNTNGTVIIFDFFRKDNIEGKSPLGGGHSIGKFYKLCKDYNYSIEHDIDVSKNLGPNLRIVNDMLKDRIIPFMHTFDTFMLNRNKHVYKLIKWFLKKRIKKLRFKYSEKRNEKNFLKFKTYRLIVLKK